MTMIYKKTILKSDYKFIKFLLRIMSNLKIKKLIKLVFLIYKYDNTHNTTHEY